jgi:hypothetical protein
MARGRGNFRCAATKAHSVKLYLHENQSILINLKQNSAITVNASSIQPK